MQALASLLFAIVPILLYVWALWEMDRYEREPFGLLALHFAWGAGAALFLGLVVGRAIAGWFHQDVVTHSVFTAPVVEELAKGALLFWTARSRHFDNVTDGIVYGMAIGFGFAMAENFLFFYTSLRTEEWVTRVVLRTLYTTIMHALAAGVFGALMGLTKFHLQRFRWPLRGAALLLAMALHGAFNYLSHAGEGYETAYAIALGLALILAVIQGTLFNENRLIKRELAEEAAEGRLNAVHVDYLASSSRRKMMGWLSPAIDKRRYCQLATRLAFRKSQARRSSGALRAAYEADVAALRADIAEMLEREMESPAARLY
jgi:protease PrsW